MILSNHIFDIYRYILGYRTRTYDVSSSRLPTRTRTAYTSSYELPLGTSLYSTKYDSDSDIEHVLPSRYIASMNSTGRYGIYSSYYRY